MLTSSAPSQSCCALDDGALLRTLTECVAHLERQPLSTNIKKDVEEAQAQQLLEQDATAMVI